MLYFAYGSNVNNAQMELRCPGAKPVGSYFLPNHRLIFRGVADIEYSTGHACYGVIWEITKKHRKALDGFEGYPWKYGRSYLPVQQGDKIRDLMFYQMVDQTNVAPPAKRYYETIKQGFLDWCLDLKPLDVAVSHGFRHRQGFVKASRTWGTPGMGEALWQA